MRRMLQLGRVWGFVNALALATPCLAAPESPRAGVAVVDITPPLGTSMAGYYHARGADGVHDPLFCRALVLETGDDRVALVTLDLIHVTRDITDRARAAIQRLTGIPGDRVLLSATHAHTGPDVTHPDRHSGDPGGSAELAGRFTAQLPDRVAGCVRTANERRQPARLSRARGQCEGLTYNRRYFMRDGTVGWNPGKLNPDLVMPAGPSDPEVGLLLIEAPAANGPAQSIATYINFAMHADTCGGSWFSADWPGALGRVLAGYHGPEHVTLVGIGASGNLNHLDFSWRWSQGTPSEQHRIATLLGAAVFRAHKETTPLGPGRLRARSAVVELPLPALATGEVDAARRTIETTHDDRGTNFMRLVRAHRVLDVAARNGQPLRAEVQVIAWDRDLAWVGLPGEIFVELGLTIRQRSPFPQTMVVELANDNLGYIPDRRSFAEGNYEPESARCTPGSGEQLVEAAVRLLAAVFEQAERR